MTNAAPASRAAAAAAAASQRPFNGAAHAPHCAHANQYLRNVSEHSIPSATTASLAPNRRELARRRVDRPRERQPIRRAFRRARVARVVARVRRERGVGARTADVRARRARRGRRRTPRARDRRRADAPTCDAGRRVGGFASVFEAFRTSERHTATARDGARGGRERGRRGKK